MNEVYIRTWTLPEWLTEKYFKDQAYYSIEELIALIEDLDSDIERLQEEFNDYKEYVKSNCKELSQVEQVD